MMRRRRLVLTAVGASVVALLVGLVSNLASADKHWPGPLELFRAHPWPSFFALGAITLICTVVVALRTGQEAATVDDDLTKIGEELAIAVSVQWEAETRLRLINDPYPLPVRWTAADPALSVDWAALVKLASEGPGWPRPVNPTWSVDPDNLAGASGDIVDVFSRIPTRRLVVLGGPGSGKTILLVRLVLDLLNRRHSGETIPVLLSLASWNPEDQDLQTWIVKRLITDYAALARPTRFDNSVNQARALLNAGRILPVLDGLDEIPDGILGLAIARINDALRPGMKLVVAARTAAFRAAVCPSDGIEVQLAGATAIEICPLGVTEVLDYLRDSAGGANARARWAPVRAALTANPTQPAAKALTTPLTAALARTVYNPRPGEHPAAGASRPTELLARKRFPSRQAVEQHLYDSFIPAAYRRRTDQPQHNRWTAAQAQRWLTFLAVDLQDRQHGTTDLAWWELRDASYRGLSGLVVGLLAGIVGAIGLAVPLGLGTGLILAASAALLARKWVPPARRILSRGLLGGILGGMAGASVSVVIFGGGQLDPALAGGLIYGAAVAPIAGFPGGVVGGAAGAIGGRMIETLTHSHDASPLAHLVNGLGFGLVMGLAVGLAGRRTPARRLRRSRLGTLCGIGAGIAGGLAASTTAGVATGLVVGVVGCIAAGYAGGLFFEAAAIDVTSATTPLTVLKRDRATFRTSALSLGLAVGLGTGLATTFGPNPTTGSSFGVGVGLSLGAAHLVATGLAVGFVQASWGSFALGRCWLAVTGRLPWRLMTFLADAHANRGVLRQVGAIYQFRHAELQRSLARGGAGANGGVAIGSPHAF